MIGNEGQAEDQRKIEKMGYWQGHAMCPLQGSCGEQKPSILQVFLFQKVMEEN